MTEPRIRLELRSGRRVLSTNLDNRAAALLGASPLAIPPIDKPDDLLARLHRPNAPGPGGEQR